MPRMALFEFELARVEDIVPWETCPARCTGLIGPPFKCTTSGRSRASYTSRAVAWLAAEEQTLLRAARKHANARCEKS